VATIAGPRAPPRSPARAAAASASQAGRAAAKCFSDMNAKCVLPAPGARLRASSAASMAGVPLPHMGTTKGAAASHSVVRTQAAASVSCMGAIQGCSR